MSYRISKFNVDKLGRYSEIFPGYAFESERFTDKTSDVALVKGENVQQGFVDWGASKYWPAADADSHQKFELRVGDVVLAMDRPWVTAGLKWAYIKEHDPKSLLVQRVSRLRAKNDLAQTYLRCVISSRYFSDYIQPIVTGVNVPHISGKQIGDFKIPLPSPPIQRKIAAIVSAYDELIENNRRRIALLEKLTEEIYREWFVRLRFPGHEKVKFVKAVPESWKPVLIGDLLKRIAPGKKYEQKTASTSGEIPILDQGQSGIIGYHDNEPGVVASLEHPVIVFANHTCYQRLIFFPFSAIQNVLPFVPSATIKSNIYWLHMATTGVVELSEYKGHWPAFVTKRIYYPGSELTELFGDEAAPLFKQKFQLEKVTKVLTKTRDLLLPRLISGKLPVENLDIQFPPGMAGELNPKPTATANA
jgi:type I restriction enzyme S subunit